MDTQALIAHLESLGLPETGTAFVIEAYTADEAGRAARSGAANLSGIFPSVKNGLTVGWESKSLELGMYWILERDPDVLAFVDQPGLITYYHRPPEGMGHGFPVQLQPDALVVRSTGVTFIDVEPEETLRAQMLRTTGYVTQDETGRFHRPGAEAEGAPDGIGYEIWTEREVPTILVRSLAYLAPASERPPLGEAIGDPIRAATVSEPGVVMSTLNAEFGADDVQAALVQGIVYANPAIHALDDAASTVRDEIYALRPLTEKSLAVAVKRSEILAEFERTGDLPNGTSIRTARRWQRERREVEALTGDPLRGLVPIKHPGNRKRKVKLRSLEIAEQVITDVYLTPDLASVVYAYGQFRVACALEKVKPFSDRTFGKLVKGRTSWAGATARYGRKGRSYAVEPPAPIIPDAASPNGNYPLAVVHCDYTLADLVLVDRRTGEVLGRPGIFRLLDGYTGVTLAILVAFDKPGKRTTLRLLRRCVRNVGWAPELLVVDLGSEHRHLELRAFAARYHMGIAWRPAAKPRYGSPIERGFGRLTTECINGLTGNTQATKNVRTLTPETDPAKRAVWDLESFTRLLEDYLAIAEDEFHADLATSPRKAFVAGLARHGARPTRFIADDDELRFMTMPYATGITRKIDPVEGVVVEGRSYISPAFAEEGIGFTEGQVRVDDENVSNVVVFAGSRWIIALHASSARKRVTSVAEAAILSDEVRSAWRRSEAERPERLERLGVFHAAARETQTTLRDERATPFLGALAEDVPSPAMPTESAVDHDGLYEAAWNGLIDP